MHTAAPLALTATCGLLRKSRQKRSLQVHCETSSGAPELAESQWTAVP